MLGRLASHCWLGSLLSRHQILCSPALSGSCLSNGAFVRLAISVEDRALQQQNSRYQTSCSTPSNEQPPQQSGSHHSQAPSAPDNEAKAPLTSSSADQAAAATSAAESHQQQAETALTGFATLPARSTSTGYAETVLMDENRCFDGSVAQPSIVPSLPEEMLRIPLRQEVKQSEEIVQIDAYTLSRSLVGGNTGPSTFNPAPGEKQQQQQPQLTAADKETLEKLIGIMTKDGKKSRARRQLLDAMHVIKQQLAKGNTTA